jgi:hypothetical protein
MVQESRGTSQVSTDAVELHVVFMGSFHSSSSLVKSNGNEDSSEKTGVNVIRFREPVIVHEIRIIPRNFMLPLNPHQVLG